MSSKVVVHGLRELNRALRSADTEMAARLRDQLKGVAGRVVTRTKAKVPKRTGRTADSVRAVAVRGGAAVRAGGARVPWYGWLDFGGTIRHHGTNHRHTVDHLIRRPIVRGGRYLLPSADEEAQTVAIETERVLDRVFRSAGWL